MQIQLTIPSPCSENWAKMSAAEQGRFCQSCQKQVVDLTGMDEQQLVLFFKNSHAGVCGRMRKDQLEKDLSVPRKRIPWFRYLLQVAIPAAVFSNRGYTQGAVLMKPLTVQSPKDTLKAVIPVADTGGYRMITGKVTDEHGNPLVYATVKRANSFQGSVADKDGFFKLKVDQRDSIVKVEVSSVGFSSRMVDVYANRKNAVELMEIENVLTGEVLVVSRKKKSIFKLMRPVMDSIQNFFRLFPNPVPSGSSINIELKGKLAEGYYDMIIISANGKSVFDKQLWIDEEARVMNIEIPALSAGTYFLTLRDKKSGKQYSQQVMVR